MNAIDQETVAKIVLKGDLSGLNPKELIAYYNYRCSLAGLDPATKPFDLAEKGGRKFLVTNKSAGEQLRRIHKISIVDIQNKIEQGVYIVTVRAQTADGRSDISNGVKSVEGLKGEALANALMSAETKAKNRVTLSLCSLGMIDEMEALDAGFSVLESLPETAQPLPEPEREFAISYDVHLVAEEHRDKAIAHLRKHGAVESGLNGTWLAKKPIPHMEKYKKTEEAA